MIKKALQVLLAFFIGFLIFSKTSVAQEEGVSVYFFKSQSCPHCTKEEIFLEEIKPNYPNINLYAYDVADRESVLLLQKIGAEFKISVGAVPMTFIGDDYIVGFLNEKTTGAEIIRLIEKYEKQGDPNPIKEIISKLEDGDFSGRDGTEKEDEKDSVLPSELKIPLFGTVSPKDLSLPALTFVIALLDGFNPCAMWVLLFLISILAGMKDRKRMWILGSTFIVASGFVYFLFLSAWLNLFLFLGFHGLVRIVVGVIAITLGIYQLREYALNRGGGCKVTGGEKRTKVFEKIKNITQSKTLAFAMIGIVLLAFAVNLVELVCSAGLPAIYTQVLSLTPMTRIEYYSYLLFYVFIFMLDDLIVFFIAMKTLKAVGIDSRYSSYTRLIGGLIILLLGILLIFKPEIVMFG